MSLLYVFFKYGKTYNKNKFCGETKDSTTAKGVLKCELNQNWITLPTHTF